MSPHMYRAAVAVALASSILHPVTAIATDFRADESIVISVPVADDLYAAGRLVSATERVNGDFIAAGETITVSGDIEGDAALIGASIDIAANVGDDVRAAGQTVRVSGNIADDLIVFGENVTIDARSSIAGDVQIYANRIYILGVVDGELKARGEHIILAGEARNGADLRGSDVEVTGRVFGESTLVAEELTLGTDAAFDGDVRYWIDREEQDPDIAAHMTSGTAIFDDALEPAFGDDNVKEGVATAGLFALAGLTVYSLLSAMLFMLLMVLLTRKIFREAAVHLQKYPGRSLLWGFLYIIVTPIAAVLFMVTIIGLPIGLFILFFYAFSLVFAKPLAALVLARWIDVRSDMRWGRVAFYFVAVGLYIVLKFVSMIPVLGWLAWFIAFLLCFGALKAVEAKKMMSIR